jgi:hypothetical protein
VRSLPIPPPCRRRSLRGSRAAALLAPLRARPTRAPTTHPPTPAPVAAPAPPFAAPRPQQVAQRKFFGRATCVTGFVDMVTHHLPSPVVGAANKVATSYMGDTHSAVGQAMLPCDAPGRSCQRRKALLDA